jgi:hypothetical protein
MDPNPYKSPSPVPSEQNQEPQHRPSVGVRLLAFICPTICAAIALIIVLRLEGGSKALLGMIFGGIGGFVGGLINRLIALLLRKMKASPQIVFAVDPRPQTARPES